MPDETNSDSLAQSEDKLLDAIIDGDDSAARQLSSTARIEREQQLTQERTGRVGMKD